MSDCTHDLTDREVACADGMCPMCLAARVRELEAEREEWEAERDALRDELRGRTQNFDDACTTLATLEAERDALRAALREIAALPATGRVHVIANAALGDRHE